MRRRLSFAAPVGVSVITLGAVIWWATRQEAPELPGDSDGVAAVLGAIALFALGTAARAERWRLILRRSGVASKRADVYGLTTVGYFGNNVLPARAGELARSFLMARRAGAGVRAVLGTVIAERLLDVLALAILLLGVSYGVLSGVAVPSVRPVLVVAAVAVALACAAGLALFAAHRRDSLRRGLQFLAPLGAASRDLLSRHGFALLAISIVIWALEAAVYMAVARAVELDLDAAEAFYVMAVTNLFASLPAAPGYVGTFDAAILFSTKTIGASGSMALSYLLLLRFVVFVPITLVGLVVLVLRYGGLAQYRASRDAAASMGRVVEPRSAEAGP